MKKFFFAAGSVLILVLILAATTNFSFAQIFSVPNSAAAANTVMQDNRNDRTAALPDEQQNPCQSMTDPDLKAKCEAIRKNVSKTKSDIIQEYTPPPAPVIEPVPPKKVEPLFKSIPPATNPHPPSPVIRARPYVETTAAAPAANAAEQPAPALQQQVIPRRSMYQ